MSDTYQSLIHTPVGQLLAKNVGLPNPVRLERYQEGDPLVSGTVVVGGDGRLGSALVAALDDLGVYPRPLQDPLPVWVAVGGNPESAIRAGTLGLPMALAIIGGLPERFAPFATLHREAARRAGHEPVPRMSINSHGYIAETSQQAADESFPFVAAAMNRIGRERGWEPMTRAGYDAAATLRGASFVGSPQQVIEKILFQHELFGHERFLVQFSVGTMPHARIMRSIELLGTEVAPAVRRELARRSAEAAA